MIPFFVTPVSSVSYCVRDAESQSVTGMVPDHVPEMLGGEFVSFLLETLEHPPVDVSDDTGDLLLTVLLALNLQYSLPADNLLLLTLRQRDSARVFTEKVMLLFNREGQCRRWRRAWGGGAGMRVVRGCGDGWMGRAV